MSGSMQVTATRTERKKEETKQKIIATAMDLFRGQGFEATTMEQIAGATDIAKGTLYNYFPVKEAILDEFIKRSFSNTTAAWIEQMRQLPDTRTRMVWLLRELMRGVQAQREIFEKYFVYRIQHMIALQPDESAKSGLHFLEAEIVTLGQAGGEIRADLPFDLLTGLFEFVFIEVAQQFYLNPGRFDADTTINQCVDLFLNGTKK
jgi:AcrR family transcriptional regulator